MIELRARPARISDAATLMAWRNDPGTLRYSVVSQPVAAGEHLYWLHRVIADPTRRLMIVHAEGTGPVGTYRLDHVGSDVVEVSLTIAPEWRGRGLARGVIATAVLDAVGLGALSVFAVVHVSNVASRRAFSRCNFLRDARFDHGEFIGCSLSWRDVAAGLCDLCRAGTPHHTNAAGSIGGGDRREVWDVHAVEDASGVGLRECDAGDLLLAWAAQRQRFQLPGRKLCRPDA